MTSNFYEKETGLVHAPADVDDRTLCGLAIEGTCMKNENGPLKETNRKVTCPVCAGTIRHCIAIGEKGIGKVKEDY